MGNLLGIGALFVCPPSHPRGASIQSALARQHAELAVSGIQQALGNYRARPSDLLAAAQSRDFQWANHRLGFCAGEVIVQTPTPKSLAEDELCLCLCIKRIHLYDANNPWGDL